MKLLGQAHRLGVLRGRLSQLRVRDAFRPSHDEPSFVRQTAEGFGQPGVAAPLSSSQAAFLAFRRNLRMEEIRLQVQRDRELLR